MSDVFTDNTDNQTNVVESLVGEGKKFADFESLARGKIEADNYIEELKAKLTQAESSKATEDRLQELIERLDKQGASGTTPPADDVVTTNAGTTPPSEDDLKKLVNETLTEQKLRETAESNVRRANEVLSTKYGDKANEVLREKAKGLNVSVDFLKSTAAQSPDAFFRLIGETVQSTGFEQTSVRTTEPTQSQSRDWNYYKELRKKDPNLYYSAKTQNQILADREAMGMKFYN